VGLLAKWRLRAVAVPLHAFLPPDLADEPRFASVHMLVIEPITVEARDE